MNVLLLQGPQGGFYKYLSRELSDQGHNCYQVVLNGGDLVSSFAKDRLIYRGTMDGWANWLQRALDQNAIDIVVVYGDCRAYHIIAREVCTDTSRHYFALEEGYIRPNYVTLEEYGVNAHSNLSRLDIDNWKAKKWQKPTGVTGSFEALAVNAIRYYLSMWLLKPYFRNYWHHRGQNAIYEGFCHIRSGIRKILYRKSERKYWDVLNDKNFFLVPLQVSYDSQLHYHSGFFSVEDFIGSVIKSFAREADLNHCLVFKHHPLDRGYHHYQKFIESIALREGIADRVYYVHDLNLPRLLDMSLGMVAINSTTAISAFHHGSPVKLLGKAFYNTEGLSDQKPLDEFWKNPTKPDQKLYLKLRNLLEHSTQINGSFYSSGQETAKKTVEAILSVFQK